MLENEYNSNNKISIKIPLLEKVKTILRKNRIFKLNLILFFNLSF